eukprot:c10265_g1_i1.p1 GENE.c10265_g1_i1~~c10265_g1_i1.p1  ORF type:complete len:369 (+),score=97.94 c10265_g1_i1:108-1109(+)
MISGLAVAFLIGCVPWFTMACGGLISLTWVPGPKLTSGFQHLAAGIVIAAVALELLPVLTAKEATGTSHYVALIAGFSLGVFGLLGLSYVLDKYFPSLDDLLDDHQDQDHEHIHRSTAVAGTLTATNTQPVAGVEQKVLQTQPSSTEPDNAIEMGQITHLSRARSPSQPSTIPHLHQHLQKPNSATPWTLLVPIAIDAIVDGMLIGISYQAGIGGGIVMTAATSIEMCFVGISLSIAYSKNNVGKWRARFLCATLPFLIPLASMMGYAMLSGLSPVDPMYIFIIAFGSSALLYLVTDELLVEAHENLEHDTLLVTIQFYVGFLTALIIQKITD